MRLFSSIAVELTSMCNRHCAFCPVAYNTRPDEVMSQDLMLKICTELSDLNYKGRIAFYIYNEPLRNMKLLLKATEIFRRMVPLSNLMISTNGDYIRSAHDIIDLYVAGMNSIMISCYSPGLYEKRKAWVLEVTSRRHEILLPCQVEFVNESFSHTVGAHNRRLLSLTDKSGPMDKGIFRFENRSGNIAAFLPPTPEPLKRMCVKPFRMLNINWKGEALICCHDYHGSNSFGNAKDSTLVELWNHPVINEYRRRLYNKDRNSPLCSKCDCRAGASPHMVQVPEGPFADIPRS